jgi:DNA-binding FadR family transcriptional regulator
MSGIFERPRLTEQVVAHMTDMITAGAWPAGSALPPEADLAQQLGVSRTVIREGVRVLASRGMLDVRQGRGTFVTPATAWNVAEPLALLVKADRPALLNWLEVRTILEMESGRLAAERASERDRAELTAALQRVCDVTQQPEEYVEADIALHVRIAQATQNPQLRLMVQTLVQPLRLELHETVQIPALTAAATREHTAIVERILAGDGAGARAAMGAHLSRVAEEINVVLNGGDWKETSTCVREPA